MKCDQINDHSLELPRTRCDLIGGDAVDLRLMNIPDDWGLIYLAAEVTVTLATCCEQGHENIVNY